MWNLCTKNLDFLNLQSLSALPWTLFFACSNAASENLGKFVKKICFSNLLMVKIMRFIYKINYKIICLWYYSISFNKKWQNGKSKNGKWNSFFNLQKKKSLKLERFESQCYLLGCIDGSLAGHYVLPQCILTDRTVPYFTNSFFYKLLSLIVFSQRTLFDIWIVA